MTRDAQMIGHGLPTIDGGMGADAARRGYAPSVNVVEGGRVLVDERVEEAKSWGSDMGDGDWRPRAPSRCGSQAAAQVGEAEG